MRIVIDGRLIDVRRTKGLGRYVVALIRALQTVDDDCEFIVLVPPGQVAAVPSHPRWRTVEVPWRWYSLGEQIFLPRLLRRLKPDLVHFPHFNVPLLYRGRFVVTIHDLLLRHWPSDRGGVLRRVGYLFKRLAYRLVVAVAVRRAAQVIVPSEFTATEIRRYYPLAKDKITVAPYAAGIEDKTDQNLDDKSVILRYTTDTPFCLYVGNHYPHKNIGQLIDVFAELSQEWPGQLLLISQADDWTSHWQAIVTARGLDQRIKFVGFVPDEDLSAFYRQAACFVTLSRYEGFGLPVIEALVAGAPVLATDHPCLREVGEPVVNFISLDDSSRIVRELAALVALPSSAAARTERQQRASRYHWLATATTHLDCYHAITAKTKTSHDQVTDQDAGD